MNTQNYDVILSALRAAGADQSVIDQVERDKQIAATQTRAGAIARQREWMENALTAIYGNETSITPDIGFTIHEILEAVVPEHPHCSPEEFAFILKDPRSNVAIDLKPYDADSYDRAGKKAAKFMQSADLGYFASDLNAALQPASYKPNHRYEKIARLVLARAWPILMSAISAVCKEDTEMKCTWMKAENVLGSAQRTQAWANLAKAVSINVPFPGFAPEVIAFGLSCPHRFDNYEGSLTYSELLENLMVALELGGDVVVD